MGDIRPGGFSLSSPRAGVGPAEAAGETLVRQAVVAVITFMRDERLKAGDTLPAEMEFAASLGVSRAVIREAYQALAALHLINVGNGRRARVSPMDGAVLAASLHHAVNTAQVSVPQVWDVRRTLELRTAALAAQGRTAAEAQAISALAQAMWRDREDLPALTRHDVAFHRCIAEASHNMLFASIVSSFAGLMNEAVPAAWRTRRTDTERTYILQQHQAVADAIAVQDPEAARLAMNGHFDESVKSLLGAGLS